MPVPGPLHPAVWGGEPRQTTQEHAPSPLARHPPSLASAGAYQSELGDEIVAAARYYLSFYRPEGYRNDCSGFVEAVTARVGVPMAGTTSQLWDRAREAEAVHRRHLPRPGDLAFFDNTWDANGNGQWDDFVTHIAVVLEVADNGTILLAHGGVPIGRGTFRMNLQSPNVRRDELGVVHNDWLRRRHGSDPEGIRYLSGELWRGFATVHADDSVAWSIP